MLESTINGKTVQLDDSERQPCEVWTRVMGYYRTVADFNVGKKAEHKDRRYFREPAVLHHITEAS